MEVCLLNKSHAFSKNNPREFSSLPLFSPYQYTEGLSLPSLDPIIERVQQRMQPLTQGRRGSKYLPPPAFARWDTKREVWAPWKSGHEKVNRSPGHGAPAPAPAPFSSPSPSPSGAADLCVAGQGLPLCPKPPAVWFNSFRCLLPASRK